MTPRYFRRCLRNLKCSIPVLIVLCVICFGVIYYSYQTNNYYRRKYTERFTYGRNYALFEILNSDYSSLKTDSLEQISLWEAIVLPKQGPRKSFSFARHGNPLNLYSRGTHIEPLDLVDNLSFSDINFMLSARPAEQMSMNSVNCRKLIIGGQPLSNITTRITTKASYIPYADNCKQYIKDENYVTSPITSPERDFPLAYSILLYTSVSQFQRLLRAIYRPQNIYCIHIDKKSPETFKNGIRNITNCFENIFAASRAVDVQWGTFSVLEPEIICMEELLRRHKKWKYFINLTGQEFPLRTNIEIVKILSAINGSNIVEGSVKRDVPNRWKAAGPPPHNITAVKGGIHVALSRPFVDFAINNKLAKDLLEWCRKVEIPDELFFSTLHNNPQLNIPGSYKGPPETDDDRNPFLARFKNWEEDWPCRGKYVRGICVFGTGDLPLLATREELFANKFHEDFQPETLDCLEEMLANRTLEETLGTLLFNDSYYRTRDFVINKV